MFQSPPRPAPSQSLAAFVLGLGDGSACFCCGGPMRATRGNGTAIGRSDGTMVAVCPSCGSEVGLPEEDADEGGGRDQTPACSLYAAA